MALQQTFRYWLAAIFCLLLEASSIAQLRSGTAAKIDSALNYLYQRGLFNGVVLLAENGKVVYQKALGNKSADSNTPLDIRSSFNLASLSKQFTAMMAMMLKEEGKFDFDDPVQSHLPLFPYPGISIRNLLTHTSGLEEYFGLALKYRNTLDTFTNDKLLQLLHDYTPPLRFESGSKWEYSNTGYIVLGSLIEKLSGMKIEEFFAKKISGPLQLKNTFIHYLNMQQSHQLSGSRVLGMERKNGHFTANDLIRIDGVVGDGNVYASAEDLLKWDQALYAGKLISAKTLEEAFRPVKLNNGSTYDYGFGWAIQDSGSTLMHTGSWVGFRTFIERDLRHKRTLIALTNGNNGKAIRIVNDILKGQSVSFPVTTLIQNVQLIDGTGIPARNTSVRLLDAAIYETGSLQPIPGEETIQGEGNVLAPGFIDTHSHHLSSIRKDASALPAVSQGITTIVIGQDGGSEPMDSLQQWITEKAPAINIASYTGHATLREEVMGTEDLLRMAKPEEVEKMKRLLEKELEKGSLGLSTGLEYEEGFYSNRDEVLELAKLTATHKGRYMSHIRSEDINQDEAIDEIIAIGREAKLPVLVSHIKIARKENWNTAPALLNKLEEARAAGIDITADVYPYTFWNSTLRVLFPNRDYENPVSASFATHSLFDPAESYLVEFAAEPSYKGKTVAEVAALRQESPSTTLMALIRMAKTFEKEHPDYKGRIEAIAAKSMSETDVEDFIAWPQANICSDGAGGGHPRGYGAFTRVLGRYVREKKIISLENAIYKMTGLPAEHLGLNNRGRVSPGYAADLVLFDPEKVGDKATIENSTALSAGILSVWVNGQQVYQHLQPTGKHPGQLLKRP
jgi:N-acyl-D-aspartate/D-glutamate deacylase/CubicO group peptidase (beta-lactamase class C family)